MWWRGGWIRVGEGRDDMVKHANVATTPLMYVQGDDTRYSYTHLFHFLDPQTVS